jgi:toxin ParE1/3/4
LIVTFSRQAEADLIDIALWIARDNPDRAIGFTRELRAACRKIAILPRAYPPAPAFGPNARRKNHGTYAIFYDVADDAILITTIVHGARNLDALP